jgi:RNA polymerase sigma factor (sigma-70 family)
MDQDLAPIQARPVDARRPAVARHAASASGVDGLGRYLDQIGGYGLLSKDDEIELARLIELGRQAEAELGSGRPVNAARRTALRRQARQGQEAFVGFFHANLRLVVSIARKAAAKYPDTDIRDFIQDGNLGLWHAVGKFDWHLGYRFSTYATWWIWQHILRAQRGSGIIRITENAIPEISNLRQAARELEDETGREPTDQELAEFFGWSPQRVREVRRHLALSVRPLSLDATFDQTAAQDGSGMTLADCVSDQTSRAELTGVDTAMTVQALWAELLGRMPPDLARVGRHLKDLQIVGSRMDKTAKTELGNRLGVSAVTAGHLYRRFVLEARHIAALDAGIASAVRELAS